MCCCATPASGVMDTCESLRSVTRRRGEDKLRKRGEAQPGTKAAETVARRRCYRLNDVLAVMMLIISLCPALSEARFGSWLCTANKRDVSRGDFQSYRFAPVLSPRMRAFRWSTSLHYLNNLTCIYRLRAPAGHHIYYELPTFDLHPDCRGDRVIIAGGDRTSRVICGSKRRLLHPYGVLRSNVVTMSFVTDGTGTATGFSGFFAAFKPSGHGGFGPLSASARQNLQRSRRDLDDDDEYYAPKTTIGEINLQQMRVLTGEASLDSYCRSMKRFGWELATSTCHIQPDPWGMYTGLRSLSHVYRSSSQDVHDTVARSLTRRNVPEDENEANIFEVDEGKLSGDVSPSTSLAQDPSIASTSSDQDHRRAQLGRFSRRR